MKKYSLTTRENLIPFIFITALFFLWGIAHGMLDVLNKHFQEILSLSKGQSGLIQFALYFAYFSMALPAGYFMKRYGYKKGIILGLLLFSGGALLIAGTTTLESFWVFLVCLFILGCGLATLETAANPYTTKLGPHESAERRINLSQSFNGLAWTIGPLIGIYIYGDAGVKEGQRLSSLMLPYLIIGLVVFIIALVFLRTNLPEITEENSSGSQEKSQIGKPLSKKRHFILGVIAQFSYVAAQTGIFSYLINFVTDEGQNPRFERSYAPYYLSIGFVLFMTGRLTGSYLMGIIKPAKLLAIYAGICFLLLPIVSANISWVSLIALYAVFFFMSIMFPTIFALAIKDLGSNTKRASSFIVMSIVGGALFTPIMGFIADVSTMAIGFLAPVPLFVIILYYGLEGHKIKDSN
ncbi:MAG: sugar MFS transporter [Melioribacteraceae bacterium]